MLPPNVCVAIVLLFTIFFVGTYDAVALMFWGQQYTVSYVVKSWASHFPILPVVVGIVLGHLFWPIGPDIEVRPKETVRNGSASTVADVGRGGAG